MQNKSLGFQVLLLALAGLNARPTIAAEANGNPVLIAPINSTPEGQTYGRWAAEWYQWALGVPAATNPLLDTTGKDCAERQVDRVWFLAGSLAPGPVVRACEIPAAKSLFFPLINNGYFAFLSDPPDQRTEAFIRAQANCTEPAQISVWIDGVTVPQPTRFFTGHPISQSPFFNVQMPPGNLFGADTTAIPDLALSPSAEQGYYLFVRPLSPGAHTIHWIASGCTLNNPSQDVTYNLTVSPLNDKLQALSFDLSVPAHRGLPTPNGGRQQ